jgi:hypothetical protein
MQAHGERHRDMTEHGGRDKDTGKSEKEIRSHKVRVCVREGEPEREREREKERVSEAKLFIFIWWYICQKHHGHTKIITSDFRY